MPEKPQYVRDFTARRALRCFMRLRVTPLTACGRQRHLSGEFSVRNPCAHEYLHYELLRTYVCNTYFCRTYLILYIHLLTNICIRILTRVRTLHLRYFCKRTFVYLRIFAYVPTFVVRTLYPYVLLHTNFRVRTFAYVVLIYVIYPLRIFAYEHLRTYFCPFCPTYFSDAYFGPAIAGQTARVPTPPPAVPGQLKPDGQLNQ